MPVEINFSFLWPEENSPKRLLFSMLCGVCFAGTDAETG
jgi:hypothetical protein